jgi:hypothetical protein
MIVLKSSRITIAITLFLTFLLQTTRASTEDQWSFLTQKDGIKVYNKSVPNSKVKALKVEVVLNTSLSAVVALLLDVKGAKEWVYHTKSCVLIKQVSPSELYYYSEVSLPWPLENRDFVAHVKVAQDKNTKVVIVDAPAVPGFIAAKKGIVRVDHSVGYWVITPMDKGRVSIQYSLQVDPGGIIPAWAVNALSSQGPIESFMKMKQMLLRPEYKNVALNFIQN